MRHPELVSGSKKYFDIRFRIPVCGRQEVRNDNCSRIKTMQKKLIIAGIAIIAILAAVLTVLVGFNRNMSGSPAVFEEEYPIEMEAMAPDAAGIPEPGGAGFPSFQGSKVTREIALERALATAAATDVDKKVIENGSLTLKVSSVDRAAENISKIAKDNGGDVFSSNIYNRNNVKTGTMQVKVPAANFEKTFSEIKKVAALVVQESTSGQDVTEEYADLQVQLKNKQAEEQQFVQILRQAVKIQDILDVTTQLSRVRGEIESLQGRIKFLNSQTDMASIFVSLSEDQNITITDSWRPWQTVKDAMNNLIRKLQGFVNFAIVLIITVIPVAILYLFLAYVVYLVGKKLYFRFKKPEQK